MALYSTQFAPLTIAAAFAQGSTALTNNNYFGVKTTAAGNMARIIEVFIGGEASSSTVNRMAIRRNSVSTTTPAAGNNQISTTPLPLSWSAPASTFLDYGAAATNATTANLPALHIMAFNAFGGVIRWVAAPGEEMYMATNTANNNDVSISSISGLGAVSITCIVEEL
jgi:hypothetical protein